MVLNSKVESGVTLEEAAMNYKPREDRIQRSPCQTSVHWLITSPKGQIPRASRSVERCLMWISSQGIIRWSPNEGCSNKRWGWWGEWGKTGNVPEAKESLKAKETRQESVMPQPRCCWRGNAGTNILGKVTGWTTSHRCVVSVYLYWGPSWAVV